MSSGTLTNAMRAARARQGNGLDAMRTRDRTNSGPKPDLGGGGEGGGSVGQVALSAITGANQVKAFQSFTGLGLLVRSADATYHARQLSLAAPASTLLSLSQPAGLEGDPQIGAPDAAANHVWSGPAAGATPGAPGYRALALADVPGEAFGKSLLGTVSAAAARTLLEVSAAGGAEWGSITGTLSAQADLQGALDLKANASALALVATSGAYADLSGLPSLFSGAYGDLSGIPSTFAPSAHVHDWSAITTGKPTTLSGYGITDALGAGAIGSSGLTMATARLLGRTTASSGAVEELTAGSSLSLAAGSLNAVQDIRSTAVPQFGGLLLGLATAAWNIGGQTPAMRLANLGAESTMFAISRWSANSAPSRWVLAKSRGATVGSHAAVQSGDYLGVLDFCGSDGSNFLLNGTTLAIYGQVDGSVSTNVVPSAFVIGSDISVPTERARFSSAGNFLLGTTDQSGLTGAGNMRAAGQIRAASTVYSTTLIESGAAIVAAGSVSVGSYLILSTTNLIDPAGSPTPSQLNNWNIPAVGVIGLSLSAGSIVISGIANGVEGRRLTFVHRGDPAFDVTFLHASGSSSAANQIICPGAANYTIPYGTNPTMVYTGSRWRLLGV